MILSALTTDSPSLPPVSKLVLASASPRRQDLLREAGAGFLVLVSDTDESADPSLSARELVKLLSVRKAKDVATCWNELPEQILILAADTVVEAPDGRILGKPTDAEDAKAMLRSLSGELHHVYTGFTLLWRDGIYTEAVDTGIVFRTLTEEDIQWYIDSGEPFGKAGSYAIQGLGGGFVEARSGDFTNVVGLPIPALQAALQKLFGKSLSDFDVTAK